MRAHTKVVDALAVVTCWTMVLMGISVICALLYYAPIVFSKSVLWIKGVLYALAYNPNNNPWIEDYQLVGMLVFVCIISVVVHYTWYELKGRK
jgi:membrane-anchored protein YejM (alkaline phosphatase superfamily)